MKNPLRFFSLAALLFLPAISQANAEQDSYCRPVADAAMGVIGIKQAGGSWEDVLASFEIRNESEALKHDDESLVITVSRSIYNFKEGGYTHAQIEEIGMALCRAYTSGQHRR